MFKDRAWPLDKIHESTPDFTFYDRGKYVNQISSNLGAVDLASEWDESDPGGSLANLYRTTKAKALAQINWYKAKVRPKRFGSQACRFTAIFLFGLAALLPLLKASGIWQRQPGAAAQEREIPFELGYVAAAAAAGLMAFDRYFGLSTGWIRYIQTELAMENALDELQYDWVSLLAKVQGVNPTA
jgi:hypothetical protein